MPIGTDLSNLAAAVLHGGAATVPASLRAPTYDDATASEATSADPQPQRDLSPLGLLLLSAAVFLVTLPAIELSHHSNFIVTLWPSNAVVLVALLRYAARPKTSGAILVGGTAGIVLASLAAGNALKFTVILAAINIVEVTLTYASLLLFKISADALTSFRGLLKFIVIASAAAPLATTAVSAIVIGSEHDTPWRSIWLHTYPAHALGILVVAPFLISVTSPDWRALRITRRGTEFAAMLALIGAIAMCGAYFRPLVFTIVPIILFATLRFGLIGTTASNLLVALITIVFIVFDLGAPLITRAVLPDRILALQVLLTFTSLWCLPIAALLKERDQLLRDLSLANSQLKLESKTQSDLVMGLRRHLSIAEEKERLRLSYELHDEAGQGLIAAILELNEIDALIEGPARERLHLVRKKMEELGKTLHRIAWELRPPSIDEVGLRKALASYIADWSERCSIEVDLHCDDPNLDAVPGEIGTAVYRIVQEGLTNIVKHAGQPSDVSVVIRRVGATLQVIIEDNGCGFDVGAVTARPGYRGLGLAGMRERLTLIGGTLEIESAIGAGATIFARIPLDSERSAA
jgi:signal transduction histidine kinase